MKKNAFMFSCVHRPCSLANALSSPLKGRLCTVCFYSVTVLPTAAKALLHWLEGGMGVCIFLYFLPAT